MKEIPCIRKQECKVGVFALAGLFLVSVEIYKNNTYNITDLLGSIGRKQ